MVIVECVVERRTCCVVLGEGCSCLASWSMECRDR